VAVLAVAGGTVPWLRTISIFETHDGSGPQDLPVTKSARAARVTATAVDPSYALEVVHAGTTTRLSLEDLTAMTQHTETLPIACVEGWSASGEWTGVRLRDLLDLVDAPAGSTVAVRSLQESGAFRASEVRGNLVDDPTTLIALRLNGEALSIDHGYPARLIAPNRPGVLQTKWLTRIEVT
jgi:DMSO/TMAO reductase YedYZ molybdopterin-dependent catalytic subunit